LSSRRRVRSFCACKMSRLMTAASHSASTASLGESRQNQCTRSFSINRRALDIIQKGHVPPHQSLPGHRLNKGGGVTLTPDRLDREWWSRTSLERCDQAVQISRRGRHGRSRCGLGASETVSLCCAYGCMKTKQPDNAR
jgi:hypothetical protein